MLKHTPKGETEKEIGETETKIQEKENKRKEEEVSLRQKQKQAQAARSKADRAEAKHGQWVSRFEELTKSKSPLGIIRQSTYLTYRG